MTKDESEEGRGLRGPEFVIRTSSFALIRHSYGEVTAGEVNADGSVTVSGFFTEIDYNEGFFPGAPYITEGLPFELRVWAGGAGVGHFAFTHPLGTDLETVVAGKIIIR